MSLSSTASVMVDPTVASLEHSHPIYLHASDTPGTTQIAIQLMGPPNYGLWSRSLRLALLVKSKLCFVDGTCLKSSYKKGELAAQWERCNVVVLSWISSNVAQELLTTIVYASNANCVWDDFKKRFDKSNLTRVYQLWAKVSF